MAQIVIFTQADGPTQPIFIRTDVEHFRKLHSRILFIIDNKSVDEEHITSRNVISL